MRKSKFVQLGPIVYVGTTEPLVLDHLPLYDESNDAELVEIFVESDPGSFGGNRRVVRPAGEMATDHAFQEGEADKGLDP